MSVGALSDPELGPLAEQELPELLQVVAYLTPLWHGVALTRSIALDSVDRLRGQIDRLEDRLAVLERIKGTMRP